MKLFSGILMDDPLYIEELITFCEKNRITVLSCLPWLAGEIADCSGYLSMLKIINTFGGRKVYIPNNLSRSSEKLGINIPEHLFSVMKKNCDDRGFIEFPSLWGVYTAVRRAAIITSINSGVPKAEIISQYGATERGLRNYCNADAK